MTRALWLGWAALLFFLFCLRGEASAEPKPASASSQPIERVACARASGVPADVDVWVVMESGGVFYDKPLFHKNLPKGSVIYVYRPGDPACRKGQSAARSGDGAAPGASTSRKGDAPSSGEAPPKGDESKKGEKPKEQGALKREPPLTAETERLGARRRRVEQARKGGEPKTRKPPSLEAKTQAELARERDKRTAALSAAKQSRRAAPIAAACQACTRAQAGKEGIGRVGQCKASPASGPRARGIAGDPAKMAVREPILKELLAYKNAKGGADKEAHRQRLRALFGSVDVSIAEAFQAKLGTQDTLGVAFRGVLADDPLRRELLGVLEEKYACVKAAPPAAMDSSPAAPSPSGAALPAVTLTDEGAFEALHTLIQQRVDALDTGADNLSRSATVLYKNNLKKKLLPFLSGQLAKAQRGKQAAFQESDSAKRTKGLKNAGAEYTGLLVLTQVVQLEVNMALVADWADAEGAASGTLAEALLAYDEDKDILALMQAGLDADAAKMAAALPAGIKRYEYYVTRLDQWIAAIQKGAVLSKKVIKVADIVMIAISIYQVAKTPVMPAGSGSSKPPTILGALPGGAAVGASVSLASLASALSAIQRLVAIGALDGAVLAGIGSLGGGSAIALPELQRPTSLSVQVPGGSSPRLTVPSGKPNPAAKPTGPRTAIHPNDVTENVRALTRENKSADVLAKAGYRVEQNPPKPVGSPKEPDYKIEGEYADCYAPRKLTPVRNIWKTIALKVGNGQASRIVLNLDDWGGDFVALQKQFGDWPIDGLIEVFIVQGGEVARFFP